MAQPLVEKYGGHGKEATNAQCSKRRGASLYRHLGMEFPIAFNQNLDY
ncbi:hypothetical protein [aff. Roholtiella sp. LEGE 12411]|nr:hypothetical protein [aff. Roholtiella sp. LEGE 12411]MBE9038591.1 hypothetical protein [aff. Roholtiella sp. LEGE 12411]